MMWSVPWRNLQVIKLALPAGDLRVAVAEVLATCGLRVEGYGEGSRSYRLSVPSQDEIAVRVFREKDIPIQIALGNYDLGVCNRSWLQELLTRYPQDQVVALRPFGFGYV